MEINSELLIISSNGFDYFQMVAQNRKFGVFLSDPFMIFIAYPDKSLKEQIKLLNHVLLI